MESLLVVPTYKSKIRCYRLFNNLLIHQFIGISSSFDCRVKLTKIMHFQINCTPVKLKGVILLSSCLISSVTSKPSINLDILSEVIFSFVRVNSFNQSIYIRTVSFYLLFSTLLIQFKLVYGPFGQSNMHITLDFYPRSARKDTNVPLHKRS